MQNPKSIELFLHLTGTTFFALTCLFGHGTARAASHIPPSSVGRHIYQSQCAQCHGDTGKGDGRAACDFTIRPANLTDADYASDSDRSLLRKVLHARKPMPNFETMLTDNERRELIVYLRSLSTDSPTRSEAAR